LDETATAVTRLIKNLTIHSEWKLEANDYDYDIALVELNRAVRFNNFIRPICLPTIDFVHNYNQKISIAGYGYGSKLTPSKNLQFINVQTFSRDTCEKNNENLKSIMTKNTFCAGSLEKVAEKGKLKNKFC
jgi:hypothetical protein